MMLLNWQSQQMRKSVTHHWSQGGLGWSAGWLALMVCPALATADEVSCQALGLTSC